MALNIGSLVGFLDLDASAFEDTLGGAMDKLRDLGPKGAAIAGAAGAIIGTGIAAGVMGGMDLEAANDKLSAQLGATGPESERLGRIAGDLYADAYGDSIDQVNEAIRGVTQNIDDSLNDADLSRISGKVLDLSTTFDEDLGATTSAVGQLMKNGLAKDADEALDIITRGMQEGVNKSDDLLDTLNEYPTVLRDLGLGGADSMGLMKQGLEAGARDADTVADALKELAIRGQDGSKTSAEGFKAIGLSADAMTAAFAKGGPTARAATDQVLDGLRQIKDPADRNAAAVALFGTKAEDLGDALFALDLDTAAGEMGKVEGAAAQMGTTLNDNAQTNIEGFKRKAQQAFVDLVGGQVLPIVNNITAFLNGNFGPALSAVGTALSSVTGFLMQHKTAALVLVGVIGALVAITQLHAAVMAVQAAGGILAYLATLGPVRAATAAWTAVQWLLNAAMTANPIGIVIAIIVALVAAVILAYKKSETFRNIVNGAWGAVKTGIGAAVDWIKGALAWFGSLPDKMRDWWGRAKDAAIKATTLLVTYVKSLPSKILEGLGNLGGLLLEKGGQLVDGLLQGIKNMGGRLASFVKQFIKDHIPGPVAEALGIASPSRVMAALTRWVPLGAIEGLKETGGRLRAYMVDLVTPPAMPPLQPPTVRLPARSVLDPNVNRAAAAGYAQGGNGGGDIHVHVTAAPGQSEYEIGMTAAAAVGFRLKAKG